MSKSVGNVVSPKAMVDAYGLDAVRYFFLREVPFGQDGSYSHEAIVARMNADLANDIGNLAQRSLAMIAKAGARTPDWRKATAAKEEQSGCSASARAGQGAPLACAGLSSLYRSGAAEVRAWAGAE